MTLHVMIYNKLPNPTEVQPNFHLMISLCLLCYSGSDEYQLAPGQSTVYTWSDPCKKREIVWWLLSKQEAKNTMEIKV